MNTVLRWSADRIYRSFYVPKQGICDLVSNQIFDEAVVEHLENLVITLDARRSVIDIEYWASRFDAQPPANTPVDCAEPGELVTWVGVEPATRFHFDEGSRFTVRLEGFAAEHWYRLGQGSLYIATDAHENLAAIRCENCRLDPDGSLQAAWLDEIGAARD